MEVVESHPVDTLRRDGRHLSLRKRYTLAAFEEALYILGISFCCQGIATTITKHVSYLLGKKKYSDTRRALC